LGAGLGGTFTPALGWGLGLGLGSPGGDFFDAASASCAAVGDSADLGAGLGGTFTPALGWGLGLGLGSPGGDFFANISGVRLGASGSGRLAASP